MAENVTQSVEVPVPLSLFGSLVTEMSPADLPEGISPDNQDVVFVPGGAASRPCLSDWTSGIGLPNYEIMYQKTFVDPSGNSHNLFLTSDGTVSVQHLVNPGVVATLGKVTPGSLCTSITAFGKEFMTFHNGVHGTDVPRTYDGTYFDRATQDGPGSNCTVANLILPPSTMVESSVTTPLTISDWYSTAPVTTFPPYDGGDPPTPRTYWTQIAFGVPSVTELSLSQTITVSGSGGADGTYSISEIYTNNYVTAARYSETDISGTGGTLTPGGGGATATRTSNSVSVATSTNHGLQVGYQALISGLPDATVGGVIASIVIDNEENPGVATVTMSEPHGLLPNNIINMLNIPNTVVGGTIADISLNSEIVTVVMTEDHGLAVGSTVLIDGTTDDALYHGQFVVTTVANPTTFTYTLVNTSTTTATVGGYVAVVWPLQNNSLVDNFYTVQTCPSATTFTISINYADSTFNGGTVTFSWDGTFYVTSVPGLTSFTYQQYGPNATTTTAGTVTPYGQAAPGLKQFVVLFQTRDGLVTAPSPMSAVPLMCNGGQYLSVSSLPIGPANVIARIVAFTGANGDNFFYIPQPGQVSGTQVSTSTVVNDNTSTSAVFDFGDLTLFDSIAIDIPGNNLFELATLGPCLGVNNYASRAVWHGMKNDVPNFVNLGFDGGYVGSVGAPCGWSVDTAGGLLDSGNSDFGFDWLITGNGNSGNIGQVSQSAYLDSFFVPILGPSTQYSTTLRLTLVSSAGGTGGTIVMDFYSPTQGVISSASVNTSALSGIPAFYNIEFSAPTGDSIPADTRLRVYALGIGTGTSVGIDELEIWPTANPYVPQFLFSYVNLPTSVDLVTGVLGATDDATQLMTSFIQRDSFLFLTQAGLHETNDLPGIEPYNWKVREVSNNCGACAPRAVATGENWSVWVTSPTTHPPVGRGLYVYTGGNVFKLSQEIQPDFDAMNINSQNLIWCQNDSVTRRIYVGVPMNDSVTPNRIYVLDYREMDTASDLATRGPIHISFTGKMICSDLSRKWTRWNVSANSAEIMAVPGVGIQMSFSGVGSPAGAFWLNPDKYTDDYYGQVTPYYTTYFFVNHEMEQQIQVGLHRKLYKRFTWFVSGIGRVQLTPYGDTLSNPWPSPPAQYLSPTPYYDTGDGLNVAAERCAFKISSLPLTGTTDNSFNINKLVVTMMQEPISPIRFGAV